jgi:thioredoxin 1
MSENIVELTDANFEEEVLKSELPVLVDFWAPWCGPCVKLTPVLEIVANDIAGAVKVGKLNIDENPIQTEQFKIRSIPALALFKGGVEVSRYDGPRTPTDLLKYLATPING